MLIYLYSDAVDRLRSGREYTVNLTRPAMKGGGKIDDKTPADGCVKTLTDLLRRCRLAKILECSDGPWFTTMEAGFARFGQKDPHWALDGRGIRCFAQSPTYT